MAGDIDGAEEAVAARGAQAADDAQEKQAEVSGSPGGAGGDAGAGVAGGVNYERAIGERDARIAELEAQGESDRIDFRLRLAGARNLKAARAVLADHDGDVEALVAAEPWLFSQAGATPQQTSQSISGTTGMEPVGVAGGSDERDLQR
jgi:hypothetical protein